MQVVEAFQSGRLTQGKSGSGELRFIITDVDMTSGFTEQALVNAVAAVAPTTFAGLVRTDISVEQLSNEVWTSKVSYAKNRIVVAETAPYALTFSTQGETVNVQQALSQTSYSLSEQYTVAEIGNAVNVDMDGVPQGVEIIAPKFEFTETHIVSAAVVEGNYTIPASGNLAGVPYSSGTKIKWTTLIASATGTVNDDIFRSFPAGSVLFAGANGSRQEDGDYEISYAFVVSPNKILAFPKFDQNGEPVQTSGGETETVSVTKGGHQFLWFHHQEKFAGEGKTPRRVTQARAVFVATVYPQSTFAAFVP